MVTQHQESLPEHFTAEHCKQQIRPGRSWWLTGWRWFSWDTGRFDRSTKAASGAHPSTSWRNDQTSAITKLKNRKGGLRGRGTGLNSWVVYGRTLLTDGGSAVSQRGRQRIALDAKFRSANFRVQTKVFDLCHRQRNCHPHLLHRALINTQLCTCNKNK